MFSLWYLQAPRCRIFVLNNLFTFSLRLKLIKMEKERFIISVFTENVPGMIQRVVSVFTRRHINIHSLTTSESSLKDVHRFTVIVEVTERAVQKIVGQLDKQIDILKAFYYLEKEVVCQEIALYKIQTSSFSGGNTTERIIRKHNARILAIEPEYVVIEKTGHKRETDALLKDLQVLGIYEFVRSGVVSITKDMEPLKKYFDSIGMSQELTTD